MPDITAALWSAPRLRLKSAADFPQDAFHGSDLVGTHHQQRIADVEHGIPEKHFQQCVFLEEGGGEILQIPDQSVVCFGPVHCEIEAVLVSLCGVGEIASVRAVGDYEELHELEQRTVAVEAFPAVAMHLIEGFANGHTAFFQLHMDQWQSVDQNGDIVAVGVTAGLFELTDHLQLVAAECLFVDEVDVLNAAIIEDKVEHMVVVNFSSFVDDGFVGAIEVGIDESSPFVVGEADVVEGLQLLADVVQQGLAATEIGAIFVALVSQVDDQFAFEVTFALIAFGDRRFACVSFQDDEGVGFGDGVVFVHDKTIVVICRRSR